MRRLSCGSEFVGEEVMIRSWCSTIQSREGEGVELLYSIVVASHFSNEG